MQFVRYRVQVQTQVFNTLFILFSSPNDTPEFDLADFIEGDTKSTN